MEIPMPQLRQDPATKEWVIIAAEHSKRPDNFKKTKSINEKPPYKEDCPFCPGNEHLPPPETLAYRSGGPPNSKGWWVRVVPRIGFLPSFRKGVWRGRRRRDSSG